MDTTRGTKPTDRLNLRTDPTVISGLEAICNKAIFLANSGEGKDGYIRSGLLIGESSPHIVPADGKMRRWLGYSSSGKGIGITYTKLDRPTEAYDHVLEININGGLKSEDRVFLATISEKNSNIAGITGYHTIRAPNIMQPWLNAINEAYEKIVGVNASEPIGKLVRKDVVVETHGSEAIDTHDW